MRQPQAPHAPQRRDVGDLPREVVLASFKSLQLGLNEGKRQKSGHFGAGNTSQQLPRGRSARARHRPRQHGANLRGPARRQERVARSPASSSQGIGSGTRPRARWWGRPTSRIRPKASRVPHAQLAWGSAAARGRRRRGRRRSPRNQPDSGRAPPRRRTGRRRDPPRGHRPRRAALRGKPAPMPSSPRASATDARSRRPSRSPHASRHHCSLISPIMGSHDERDARQLAGERGDHDEVGASRRRRQQRGEVPVEIVGAGRLAHRLAWCAPRSRRPGLAHGQ